MRTKRDFMQVALAPSRAIDGPPVPICPFADWDYFYLQKPLRWVPDGSAAGAHRPVEVPAGFVTDLASVPQIFWNILPPQGRYAYPAIIHDYLYWFQPCERDAADEVLKVAMGEMRVEPEQAITIYKAVRLAGSKAWASNRAEREAGGRRVLTRFPDDVVTTWAEWKTDPTHFL